MAVQTDQLEANINRCEVIFAFAAYPIDQERLDVRFHPRESDIVRYQ